jgi:hypothetical protein
MLESTSSKESASVLENALRSVFNDQQIMGSNVKALMLLTQLQPFL